MKSILIQLDEPTYKALTKAIPAARRQRSEFIRRAVRRAVHELEFQRMEQAYRRKPDTGPESEDWSNWEEFLR